MSQVPNREFGRNSENSFFVNAGRDEPSMYLPFYWCLWCNSAICCGDKIGELLCGKCKIEDSRMYKHGREIAIRREAAAMRAILGKASE
jgi:hypothetical protein